MSSRLLHEDGWEIHRALFDSNELIALRESADKLAADAGSACVRHIRRRSDMMNAYGKRN